MANTLNYSIKDKDISFNSKALTIDGKEFPYKDITAIKHSSAKNLYLFKVDGKWNELYYDEVHKKAVSVIFKKIYNHLASLKNAQVAKTETCEPAPVKDEAPSLIKALGEAEDLAAETISQEENTVTEAAELPSEEKADTNTEAADNAEAKADNAEAKDEAPADDAEKAASRKSKFKKAIIVFAIIIALFIIAGVVYYFTIGLPSNSAPTDGTDTHQYNDIEELIDEMQK